MREVETSLASSLPLVGGEAQAFHDDQVVELRVQLGEATQGSALMDDYGDIYDKTQILSQ